MSLSDLFEKEQKKKKYGLIRTIHLTLTTVNYHSYCYQEN